MNGNGSRYAQVTGWGMCAPERVLTNHELERALDTSDEWIVSHTGIRERHVVASERETTASLATRAARSALLVAGVSPDQLDLVIVATVTPEHPFPSTASLVQDALGAAKAGAFDLSAGCSGFIYALSMGASAIRSGSAEHVLVVGAETLSRIVDWTDRNTCILFGDGAGAVVLSACDQPCGVLASVLGSDGSGGELLIIPAGGSRCPTTHETITNGDHYVRMNGREVFRFATQIMPKATEQVAQKAGWQLVDLGLIVPHQANGRIIDSAIKRLGLPSDRFFVNVDRYGNTSSASIPIALCEAISQGRVHDGDKVVLVGFGAGLTWAAAAIEWGRPASAKPQPRWQWLVVSLRLGWAGVRSPWLRLARHSYNLVLGPEGREDWRGQLRRRADAVRARWKTKKKR
jgi:3-oxoacyl-[acyl-carrier-protein] synthase-3